MTKPKSEVNLTVEQRIRDAAIRKMGGRFSVEDVLRLYGYDEIRQAAASDDNAMSGKAQGGQKTLLDQ